MSTDSGESQDEYRREMALDTASLNREREAHRA